MSNIIVKYPNVIEIPNKVTEFGGKPFHSILYSEFKRFTLEDERSQINWYFLYKNELKKLIIFKEHKLARNIIKYEIPTVRHLKGGIPEFLERLKKIGIDAKLKGE